MKCLALMAGALVLVATVVSSGSFAAAPVRVNPAVHVQVAGTPATNVGYRRYPRAYRYNYGPRYRYNYGPRYRYNGYYGPGYRSNYYRGPRYAPNYYYGPGFGSYYRGPAGAVNVYPGGVDVGGLHVGY